MKLVLGLPVIGLLSAWAAGCLWIEGPASRVWAGACVALFLAATIAACVWVRPWRRMWVVYAALFLAVQAWWLSIPPSNDREWLPDVARLPHARFEGDVVTLENVRNFHYRSETDYDEIWETRTYDLSQVVGLDMFLVYWGSPMIAHTIMSWTFEDGRHLAISIETRKEVGESYSAVRGFFRQYEIYYVVADERDLVGLRAAHRGEQVFLYRLRVPPETARELLVDYLDTVDELGETPRWYNALRQNCTTAIRRHAKHIAAHNPFSWKIIVNGYLDELGYDRGTIDTSLPFEELRRRSDVTARARDAIDAPDFSARIREGLPGAHSARIREGLPAAHSARIREGPPGARIRTPGTAAVRSAARTAVPIGGTAPVAGGCGWRAPRPGCWAAPATTGPHGWRGVSDMRDLGAS